MRLMPAPVRVSVRRIPVLFAVVVALAALPSAALAARPQLAPTGGPAAAEDSGTKAATTSIAPGSVNRSSMALDVRYKVSATLRYENASIGVTATLDVRNTSGAGVDRLELNLVPARLGNLRLDEVSVDGRAVTARRDDQTLVVPLGGVLPVDASTIVRVRYTAFFKADGAGSNWMFARVGGTLQLYRWIPWVNTGR